MTQYHPIRRLVTTNRDQGHRSADQRLASLNVFMNQCAFMRQEQT